MRNMITIFLLGFFLDWIEITLIILPFLAPVMVDLGVDLVWFIVMFAVVLQTSFITPPVGFNLFVLQGMANKDMGFIAKSAFPLFLLMVLAVMVIIIFPDIALWLPEQMIQPLK